MKSSRVQGIAYKCGCGSVWCKACSRSKFSPQVYKDLKTFDWRKVRFVTYTIDRTKFKNGREAYLYVTRHKKIAAGVRELRRKYGAIVAKWRWVIEWHRDGFPHWHMIYEAEKAGRAGMIGGERLRHEWGLGRVHETFIDNEVHWHRITGYFDKHGYFETKEKGHQVTLPGWAQEEEGLIIRRTGSDMRKTRQKQSERIRDLKRANKLYDQAEIIDLQTGEITKIRKGKRPRSTRTYKAMFKDCGQQTRVKILTDYSTLIFTVNIPYKVFRERVKGEYRDGVGYTFGLGLKMFNYLWDRHLRTEHFNTMRRVEFLFDRIAIWHEVRIKRGYFEYSKVYG